MPKISSELLFKIYNNARTQTVQGRKKKFIYNPIRKHYNYHLFG